MLLYPFCMSIISYDEHIAILNLYPAVGTERFDYILQENDLHQILTERAIKALVIKISANIEIEPEELFLLSSLPEKIKVPMVCCFCENAGPKTIKSFHFADIRIAAGNLTLGKERADLMEELIHEGWIDYLVPSGDAFDFSMEIVRKITKNRDEFLLGKILEATRKAANNTFQNALNDEVRIFCELAQKAYRYD